MAGPQQLTADGSSTEFPGSEGHLQGRKCFIRPQGQPGITRSFTLPRCSGWMSTGIQVELQSPTSAPLKITKNIMQGNDAIFQQNAWTCQALLSNDSKRFLTFALQMKSRPLEEALIQNEVKRYGLKWIFLKGWKEVTIFNLQTYLKVNHFAIVSIKYYWLSLKRGAFELLHFSSHYCVWSIHFQCELCELNAL